jgi:hypothetical protein
MRKNNRRMSVVISWSFLVVDFKVLGALVLIDLEEEVRLSLHVAVNVLSKTLSLLAL